MSAAIVCTVIFTIIFSLALPICSVVFGAIYRDEFCSSDLQTWLIVSGAVGIGVCVITLANLGLALNGKLGAVAALAVIIFLAALFNLAWLIYGAVLVADTGTDRCYNFLYKWTLAMVILGFIGVLFTLISSCSNRNSNQQRRRASISMSGD